MKAHTLMALEAHDYLCKNRFVEHSSWQYFKNIKDIERSERLPEEDCYYLELFTWQIFF